MFIFSAGVYAADDNEVEIKPTHAAAVSRLENSIEGFTEGEGFCRKLLEEFPKCPEGYFDISEFNIPYSKDNADAIRKFIWRDIPELYNVTSISFQYLKGIFIGISAAYNCTAEEYASNKAIMDPVVYEICDGIAGNASLSEYQKALLLHDRMNELIEYDSTDQINCFNMVGVFRDGKAVCNGYTLAYAYLLDICGITSEFCISAELNHAWNIVTIDGVRYHVDATWDDYGTYGMIYHDFFLISTAAMQSKKHDATDYDLTPNDTRYENGIHISSQSGFQLVGDSIYYIDHTKAKLMKWDYKTASKPVELISVADTWFAASDNHFWNGNYSSLTSENGRLFYNLRDKVYEYVDGEGKSLYTPTLPSPRMNITGIYVHDGYLYMDITQDPLANSQLHSKDAQSVYYLDLEHEKFQTGDVNGDGKLNSKDASALLKFLAGQDVKYVASASDFNGDGKINSKDASALLKYLAKS